MYKMYYLNQELHIATYINIISEIKRTFDTPINNKVNISHC